MRLAATLLYVCFFVSGVSALIYEIVWQRMLTLVFGVSTWSIAAVLTAYMAGLALGAWAFGRIADRMSRLTRGYAAIELSIGAVGIAVSFAIGPILQAYVQIDHATHPGPYVGSLIRFGLSLAALIVPCTLIGATVPFMTRLVTRRTGAVGSGFGSIYAINTLGAVVGAGLAGFVLIRVIGMHAAIVVAVAGNAVAGLLALSLGRWVEGAARTPRPEAPIAPTAMPEPTAFDRRGAVLLIAGLTGLAALGYEVAWSRLLAIYTLNSIYVFTMILTVYLAGLSIGSGLSARLTRRDPDRVWLYVGLVQMALAMLAPLVLAVTQSAATWGSEYEYRSATYVFLLEYSMAAVVVFLPTVLLGMTLPLLVSLLPGGESAAGRIVGKVYASNSIGTILGAATTGLVLIPWLGIRSTLMVFALLNFCIGCYGAAASLRTGSVRLGRLIPVASVLLVALSLLVPFGTQFIRPVTAGDQAILYYAEGNNAVVHIAQTRGAMNRDYRVLYVDSQSIAGTSDEITTNQKMLAHLPLLLHPDPQVALNIGYGSGGTSYSMLLHHVRTHCVEIEKAVPAGARFFVEQNGGVVGLEKGLDRSRTDFQLIIDDARSWLNRAVEPYDVITDDATRLQYRGNGNLYTVECFELIKSKLTPFGVACVWLPITGVELEPLRMVVRSFVHVFPHTSIWYMNNLPNDFMLLIGTPQKLFIDIPDWQERMADPQLAEDLKLIHLDDPYKLASCLLVAEDNVRRFAGDGPLHTDDRPLLDYLTHADMYRDTLAENLRALMACRSDIAPYVRCPDGADSDGDGEQRLARWQKVAELVNRGHIAAREWDPHAAGDFYRRAHELVPRDAGIAELAGMPIQTETDKTGIGTAAEKGLDSTGGFR